MIFEQIATGGCQSYLLGCEETHAAVLIDPNLKQMDHYMGLAARDGLRGASDPNHMNIGIDLDFIGDYFSPAEWTIPQFLNQLSLR